MVGCKDFFNRCAVLNISGGHNFNQVEFFRYAAIQNHVCPRGAWRVCVVVSRVKRCGQYCDCHDNPLACRWFRPPSPQRLRLLKTDLALAREPQEPKAGAVGTTSP